MTDTEQLPLDFSVSVTQRHKKAVKAAEETEQLDLFSSFSWSPNIDIHLDSADEAVAQIAGKEPERAHLWISGLTNGNITISKPRRVSFPARYLDRFLYLRPPAHVTLDAAAAGVAKAIWASKLGLSPLHVTKKARRLAASSKRWPAGFSVKDVPWSTIATCIYLNLPLEIDPDAEKLLARRLNESNLKIGTTGVAGSAVVIETRRPEMVERLNLPGLAYDGIPSAGRYKLPLLSAEPLLRQEIIEISPSVSQAISKATAPTKPLTELPDSFPWTLYPFQAADAGRGKRILETTGGVLLAGDMGSGKTTVSLALVADLNIWPLLVVSPLSAFSTWSRQLKEMEKSHYLAVGSPKQCWEDIEKNDYEAVVISFDRLAAFAELIERKHFRGIVADEIQRIRTPGSRRSRSLRALASTVPYRIGLSGTPLTNSTADVLPLAAFLAPGEWKPRANSKELDDLYPGDPVESLAEHLGSLMVRRRMDQTGAKLPKRNDHRIYIQLTPEQKRALAALEAEAEAAKEAGEFDDNSGRMHAFARLQKMRQIVNSPAQAGVGGPNPKVSATIDMAKEFLAQDRKGVIFCADRTTFQELGRALDAEKVGWVGIWGSTSPVDRIENERKFHANELAPNGYPTSVVVCTIQAGAESWSASPTGTWLISTAYVYAPSTLAQAEARVHRMNSDLNGPEIEIMYIHAQAPGGTLDDRMVEILEIKKHLFAQVVDRQDYVDKTSVHYSMGDLVYLLTGTRDERKDKIETDRKQAAQREQERKEHAKRSLYKNKGRNKGNFKDDGSWAKTLEDYRNTHAGLEDTDDLDVMLQAADELEDL